VSSPSGFLRALVKELRPHQWAKNALVLVPALLAPGIPDPAVIGGGLLGAFTFSLCASAGYVLNDLLDLEADRAHVTKKNRPFASGALPVAFGPPLGIGLVLASFALAYFYLPLKFLLMLALYLAGTISYSLFLKKQLLVDVLVLAGLYAHRILSGGVATDVHVSAWLIGFSIFFFTSLAFAKRYVELKAMSSDDKVKNRGYFRTDLEMVTSMGTASAYISALVFMLYVDSSAVRAGYREPAILWLALPVLLYWLGRIWLLAGRGQMQDDPVRFALKDLQSIACGATIVGIALLARFPPEWLIPLFH
jgi:4-hydroxybenzoate polyprenyltransferase